jgi:hypothetical protein
MLLAADHSRVGRRYAFLSLVPAFVLGVGYGGRQSMLSGLFFFAAGFWSMRALLRQGRVPLLTVKFLLMVVLLVPCLMFISAVIVSARVDKLRRQPLAARLKYLPQAVEEVITKPSQAWHGRKNELLGAPYTFSVYLEEIESHPQPLSYGTQLFSGLLDLVGLKEHVAYFNFEIDEGVWSNVHTIFAPPIADFGLFGSFVDFFAFGLLTGFVYGRVINGAAWALAPLAMFYPNVLSVGGYFLSWNSVTLCFVLVHLYVWFPNRGGRPKSRGIAKCDELGLVSQRG